MVQRLKRWESPRRQGRNNKGKGGSARQRQLKKQQQMLRKKLKENAEQARGKGNRSLPFYFWELREENSKFKISFLLHKSLLTPCTLHSNTDNSPGLSQRTISCLRRLKSRENPCLTHCPIASKGVKISLGCQFKLIS